MRLRNIPGSREAIASNPYVIHEDVMRDMKGRWHEVFGSNHPLFLEIGMGKGKFITELAEKNPSYNYVGIEKYSSVLIRALQKREALEKAAADPAASKPASADPAASKPVAADPAGTPASRPAALVLPNLRYLRMEAEDLTDVFGEGEVAGIYLNFSDPWPKDRHAHRRLPSRQFLERYKKVLTAGGIVIFKTDNQDLFSFALEEAAAASWKILALTRDLHTDPVLSAGNIMTEYEERFSAAGNPICYCELAPGQ